MFKKQEINMAGRYFKKYNGTISNSTHTHTYTHHKNLEKNKDRAI